MEDTRSSLNCCEDTAEASKKGHLNCLKKLHLEGCKWHKSTIFNAAFYGRLECLKYTHENGYYWDDWTMCNAAKNGSLECLFYCLENDCPVTNKTLYILNYNMKEKDKNLLINIKLRKVLLHPRLKEQNENYPIFAKYINKYEQFIDETEYVLHLKTTLPSDIIKYEVMKYI